MKKLNCIKSKYFKFLVFLPVYLSIATNVALSQDSSLTMVNNDNSFKLISHDSKGTFIDGEASISRDCKIIGVGVRTSFRLVKINEKTGEFNSTFLKGKLFMNKAVVACTKFKIKKYNTSGWINYFADKIDSVDNRILLKGNAKIFTTNLEEYIEADEIIIEVRKDVSDYINNK
jgi:hypothetical protein